MIDYLIVGSGLAGISFAEAALQNQKSILIIDNQSQNASLVAGGLYNPVILKRFSEVWQAQQQLQVLDTFYQKLETKLNIKVDYKIPILRKFFSVEEQNNWFSASDNKLLAPFLSLNLVKTKFKGINSPFDYGQVLRTGYVDTKLLLDTYKIYLIENKLLLQETFDYQSIQFHDVFIEYKQLKAKQIIFAEGFGLHANPYFNYLPLDGTKGELFIIKAPQLNLDVIINTSVFILPLGNDLFKVGATYNWQDKTNLPTEEGKSELLARIHEILNCEFEIIDHFAGVRPTVRDRKPLIGTHLKFPQLHILNGLGTRGVMLGPSMAIALFESIEYENPLDKTIDIRRYDKKL
ncbi:MAG: FAD-binding oxidoreductase [Flavobacterium sp.]|nr:FAD-binding oxidoreductase [Flavobacterium sp.]